MIIIAGHLRVQPADRDRFLTLSRSTISAARTTAGCHDFVVAADPLEKDRVNIYERWQNYHTLQAFRGDGPTDDLATLIISASIDEFAVVPRDQRA